MRILITILLCLLCVINIFAQVVTLPPQIYDELIVESQLYFLRDTAQLSFSQVKNLPKESFTPYDIKAIPAGASVHWFRLELENPQATPKHIAIGTSQFEFLDYYLPDSLGSYTVQKTCTKVLNEKKEILYVANSFGHLWIASRAKVVLFFRAEETERPKLFVQYQPLPFSISDYEQLMVKKESRNNRFRYFIGAFLIMFFYNLFLYFITKDRIYFYYSILTIFVIVFNWGFSGSLAELLPNVFYSDQINTIIGLSSIIAKGIFAKQILIFQQYKRMNNMLNLAMIALLTVIVSIFVGIDKYLSPLAALAITCLHIACIYVSYNLVYKQGYTPAKYYFWGHLLNFCLGNLALVQTSTIFHNFYFSIEPHTFTSSGALIELSLFSLSIGSRINSMQDELKQKELEQAQIRQEEEAKRIKLIEEKNAELEEKVQQRTQELLERNEEINQQHEELKLTNEQLAVQHRLLDHAYRDIQASINYAQRIQQALLPTEYVLDQLLGKNNYFVIFRPRDIVSGDFYWATQVHTKLFDKQDTLNAPEIIHQVIVTADCTGHGVPGAFMSMIGANMLDHIINDKKIVQPHLILQSLDIAIRQILKQEETNNRDGMDVGICVINQAEKTLEFAAAHRPLWFIAEGEYHEIKGTPRSIGGHQSRKTLERFQKHTIPIQPHNTFYMFSDGFADQIGGKDNRKYMIKNFRNLLKTIYQQPLHQQAEALTDSFIVWKGREKQIDDILVVGFKV